VVKRVLLLAAVAWLWAVPAAAQQGRLRAGYLEAAYAAGLTQMRLRYEVEADAGARQVPVSLLDFSGAAVEAPRFRVSGADVPVPLQAESHGRRIGNVPIDAATAGNVIIEIEYAVRSLDSRRVRLPLVAVLWPPAQALPGVFTGELRLDGGLAAFNTFPATLREGNAQAGARAYTLSMPVLPAVVSFHIAEAAPAFTLAGILDAVVVLLTLAFCGLLWRQFRAQAGP
jgi:hypothetical protein